MHIQPLERIKGTEASTASITLTWTEDPRLRELTRGARSCAEPDVEVENGQTIQSNKKRTDSKSMVQSVIVLFRHCAKSIHRVMHLGKY